MPKIEPGLDSRQQQVVTGWRIGVKAASVKSGTCCDLIRSCRRHAQDNRAPELQADSSERPLLHRVVLGKKIDVTACVPLDGFGCQWRRKLPHPLHEFFIADLNPGFEKRCPSRAVEQIWHYHRISFRADPRRHGPLRSANPADVRKKEDSRPTSIALRLIKEPTGRAIGRANVNRVLDQTSSPMCGYACNFRCRSDGRRIVP